jgi:hypothetical protein
MTIVFENWGKTTRFKDVVYTEKIDGTNAAVAVFGDEFAAQSRKRLITPDSDNFGFAAWAYANQEQLTGLLGQGRHFGEWWGKGIQRGYGLGHRRFSVFNTGRWFADNENPEPVDVGGVLVGPVPVLAHYALDFNKIDELMNDLREGGSKAAPGFMKPEGICIFDTQSGHIKKVTFEFSNGKWDRPVE